jgi:mxaD protein
MQIGLDAESLWRKAGHFGDVGAWHPALARVESEGDQPGAIRRIETRQGDKQVEQLDQIDPVRHLYRYSMKESALPLANYTAEFRIDNADMGTSTVIWSARFEVTAGNEDNGIEIVRQFLKRGLHNLKRTCARPTA